MNRIELDFSTKTLGEVLIDLHQFELPAWFLPAFTFLKSYENSTVVTFFTSGTTGSPKEVYFTKKQVEYSVGLTLDFFKLNSGDKVLLPLSCNYVAGKMMLCRAIHGGLNLTCVSPSSNPILSIKAKEDFVFCPIVPMQLHTIIETNSFHQLNKLGVLLIGGAALDEALQGKLKEHNVESWSSFGMTETLTHFALKQNSPQSENSFKCIGDYTITVDEESCLVIKNEKLFSEPLHCNDVIEMTNNTTFNWLGRKDNVVNSGGVKLYPEQLELKIKKLLSSDFSFVLIGIPDKKLGQRLLFVSENYREVTVEEMKLLKEQLGHFEFPKEFKVMDRFERTASGKIKKRALLSFYSK